MRSLKKLTLPPRLKRVVYGAWRGGLSTWARDRVLAWPPVESQEQMDDLLTRLRFYFRRGERVVVPRASESIEPRHVTPPYLGTYDVKCRFEFPVAKNRGARPLMKALANRRVVLTGQGSNKRETEMVQFLPNVAPIGPRMTTMEASWMMKLFHEPEQRTRVADSHARFLRWRDALPRKKKAYLLCTGPSLSRFREFDMLDGHTIGCNTVVKNEELMERTRPVAVTAADPNFFFGPSVYAWRFREDLRAAMDAHPFTFFTIDPYHQMMHDFLPNVVDRIFLVPQYFPHVLPHLEKDWQFPKTWNVLTMMMLPLAASIAEEIYIIGADGRAPDETYFWKHDPSSQLTDKLQAMKECHPLFFESMNYEDYYDRHCECLEEQVQAFEARGGRVFSLTESHIPAMQKRLWKK